MRVATAVHGRRWSRWSQPTGIHALATAALALLLCLGARHLAIDHRRLVAYGIPLASIALAALVGGLAHRWEGGWRYWFPLLDLGTWTAPLLLLILARHGAVDVNLWLAVTLLMKVGVLLLILAGGIWSGRLTERLAGWLLCALAILFVVAPLPFTRFAIKLKGDEGHYLVATVSLLREHDLFLENQYAEAAYAPFYDGALTPAHVVPAREGHVASFHDAGLSILALPPYWLGGWLLVLVAMGALAGLTLREVVLCARLLGVDSVRASLGAVAVGFSPPFVIYATQVYPEVPAALATLFALRKMIAAVGQRSAPLAAGLSLAVLPWLHVRFWALVAPLVLMAFLIWPNPRTVGAVLAPLAGSTAAYMLLIYAVYGRVTLAPLFLDPTLALRGWPAMELGALPAIMVAQARPWLDPYDGLLLLSPIYFYALAAMPSLLRVPGFVGGGVVMTAVSYTALIGFWYLRSNTGDSPPGRFMVAVLPLLGVGLAYALQRQSLRFSAWLGIPLAAASVASAVVSLSQPLLARYPYEGKGGPIAILSRALGVPADGILPSFSSPKPASLTKAGVVLLVVGLLAAVIRREPPNGTRGHDREDSTAHGGGVRDAGATDGDRRSPESDQ